MNKPLCAFAFLLLAGAAHAGETTIDDAFVAYENKQYQRCADILAELEREGVPPMANGELFRAECLSNAGHVDAALKFVDSQLPYGRIDLDDLQHKDRPGLNAMRKSKQWPALLAKAKKLDAERQARVDQPLRKELLERIARDQALEHAVIDSGETSEAAWEKLKVGELMADNTAWLKKTVAEKGWPGISQVGEDGARAAFLIVQHSDADPAFQAQVLPLLEAAAAKREAFPNDLALLTDRVLVAQGKPQRYGSQFANNDDGSMSMRPVEDEAGLDARRLGVGLPTIADYKQMLSEMYHKPVK